MMNLSQMSSGSNPMATSDIQSLMPLLQMIQSQQTQPNMQQPMTQSGLLNGQHRLNQPQIQQPQQDISQMLPGLMAMLAQQHASQPASQYGLSGPSYSPWAQGAPSFANPAQMFPQQYGQTNLGMTPPGGQ